jgi:hypothetical protein
VNPSIKGLPARLVACCTASSAFTIAILTGLFVGNDVESTVSRALAAMVVCYVAGRLIGLAFESVLRERIESELRGTRGAEPAPNAPEVVDMIEQTPGQAPATRARAA